MKCSKELFSKDSLKNNILSYILLIKYGYPLLNEEISNIINLIEKLEKNKNNNIENNVINTKNKGRKAKKIKVNFPLKKNLNLNLNLINNVKIKKGKNSNSILYPRNKGKSVNNKRIFMKKGKKKLKRKKEKF